jgi:hypothetical protein
MDRRGAVVGEDQQQQSTDAAKTRGGRTARPDPVMAGASGDEVPFVVPAGVLRRARRRICPEGVTDG